MKKITIKSVKLFLYFTPQKKHTYNINIFSVVLQNMLIKSISKYEETIV